MRPAVAEDPARALAGFQAPVRAWFQRQFIAPTRAQALAWPLIQSGDSTLVLAPTGSGKTLAAFLWALDRLLFEPVPPEPGRCRLVYISPLRSLAADIERNLAAPLRGIAAEAAAQGRAVHQPRVAVRTGDTPTAERAAFVRRPADLLITTPESLYLLLTTRAREALRSVRCVIVDEVHALLGNKRGAHLALSLERLEALREGRLQRIGLSATVHPVQEAARLLGGMEADGTPRPVQVADARGERALQLQVDWRAEGPEGVWSGVQALLLQLIERHRSTLIFVGSRRLAERLAAALNEQAGRELARAHHGSLAPAQRGLIEEQLRAGALPALVATSSLELGIDMGAVDLVVLLGVPPSVASGLQRVGRAGHRADRASAGVILPRHRGELLACAALAEGMLQGAVEPMRAPREPLDVLCQQVVAMAACETWQVDELYARVRRAAPYAELSRPLFEAVLDLVSGRHLSGALVKPRLHWDRAGGTVRALPGALQVALLGGGTLPDRSTLPVFLAGEATRSESRRVGELDEEMVLQSRVGDTFVLGASTWRIEEIRHDRVLVSPAPGELGKMPFWRGEQARRPPAFGWAIGALLRRLRQGSPEQARQQLIEQLRLTASAAAALLDLLDAQVRALGCVPDDRTLVAEWHPDGCGQSRLCLLSPLGGQVLGPLALCLEARARRRLGGRTEVLWSDDGMVARLPGQVPSLRELLPEASELETELRAALRSSPQLSGCFREAAVRALLLPRRSPRQRRRLWRRSAELLQAAMRSPNCPLLLEAYRECMHDVFDLSATQQVLAALASGALRLVEVRTARPSPLAAMLLLEQLGWLSPGDAPPQERRAQALLVDPQRLRELIGPTDLREVLEPDEVHALQQQLQHLSPERRARHADGLHGLLLRLGDLTAEEIAARCDPPEAAPDWLATLVAQGRVVLVSIAGQLRYVAVEDAARYRDALGVVLPPGLPAALLEPVPEPLRELLLRHARTHGPFTAEEVAARLGLSPAVVQAALTPLVAQGQLVAGAFRPGRGDGELCDAQVLQRLRHRSLVRARQEVAPVAPAALARFALSWHGIGVQRHGVEALRQVVRQLEGLALPASVLEQEVLPARLARYQPHELDQLLAGGEVSWVGAGALGEHDGRVRLLCGNAALRPPPVAVEGILAERVRQVLRSRGACFFSQILAALGGAFPPAVLEVLWQLLWAGQVCNDTLQPLRARLERRPSRCKPSRAGTEQAGPGGAHRAVPPEARGRWTLVATEEVSPEERARALATMLLRRHGVLVREALADEEIRGGFAAVYPALRAMEEAGQVRRGYFVAGRGAAQFALPGALERLRALREPGTGPPAVVLSAVDPANPYGAALPWPAALGSRRPARTAGARVVLLDGELSAWLSRTGEQLLTFGTSGPGGEQRAARVAHALGEHVDGRPGCALHIVEVNGQPVGESELAPALVAAGFRPGARGYLRRSRRLG
ncbi:MAG: DEAD/DEAH box helicase [Myxococcales bacterium]|nr:DEAD/DEAH box helicase [Myxococcota bacterium]MDW8282256.1 DEAD/DEAH box helicase [Myxococcales bacterium]